MARAIHVQYSWLRMNRIDTRTAANGCNRQHQFNLIQFYFAYVNDNDDDGCGGGGFSSKRCSKSGGIGQLVVDESNGIRRGMRCDAMRAAMPVESSRVALLLIIHS